MTHIPVLLNEVIEYLDIQSNKNYIDATLGGGGYTREILKRNGPDGKVVAIDWNEEAIKRFQETRYSILDTGRLILIQGNFRDIATLVHFQPKADPPLAENNIAGVVFDLGLSSDLIELSGRGFSFERDEPLIMSYQLSVTSYQLTAGEVVNSWDERGLEKIFREYGEEQRARPIARAIVEARRKKRIKTTGELVQVIESVSRSVKTKARIFQALRIAVNDELENLKKGLEGAWEILAPNGRIVVVSYHSLEDRIVKNFFRQKRGEILTKKPVRASAEEVKNNPRSRSAKLRAISNLYGGD